MRRPSAPLLAGLALAAACTAAVPPTPARAQNALPPTPPTPPTPESAQSAPLPPTPSAERSQSADGPQPAERQSDRPVDLTAVLDTGYILQDRNGDDVVDYLAGRILLPPSPGEAELAAASNIAARLGYETSAADLGRVETAAGASDRWDVPVVLVGLDPVRGDPGDGPGAAGAAPGAAPDLSPGAGAVRLVPPGETYRRGGLALEGYDATGLIAAGDYVAGRYPSVWALDGPEWSDVVETFRGYLEQRSVPLDTLTLERIVVEAGRPGVARARVRVRVPDAEALERAVRALEAPESTEADTAAAGRQGGGGPDAPNERDEPDEPGEPAEADRSGGDAPRPRLTRSDLDIRDLHRIDIRVVARGGRDDRTVRLLPRTRWETSAGPEAAAGSTPDFTLSDLYTIRGLYRDTNQDLVPDRTRAYVSLRGAHAPGALGDLALRAGLETAGMRLPFVRVDGQDDYPELRGFPILYGVGHHQTERLRREGRLDSPSGGPPGRGEPGRADAPVGRAGQGFIEFVEGAFADGEKHGLVIGAEDARGLGAVTDYVARRMPYLWEHGKGEYGLKDVETEVRRFFEAETAPGQLALALYKLDDWLDRLEGRPIDSLAVELATDEWPEALDAYIADRLRERFPDAAVDVSAHATGFGVGDTIFRQEVDFEWEVDAARTVLREDVLPVIAGLGEGSGSDEDEDGDGEQRGRIEVRVSEPPEVRARLEAEIRDSLEARGVDPAGFDIDVLSAYKQGYSWLHDEILPELRGADVARIEIRYHHLDGSEEVRWQTIASNTRWLQELYPIDAVLARELSIPDTAIAFEPTLRSEPVYSVRALDAAGNVILEDAFDPKYVVRPFFDLFPEYERVRVTTGWITVEAGGRTVVDRRIETDPERFWDFLQTNTYRRIVDYTMDVQQGRPSGSNAPYFDALRIDLRMSEPNRRIGVDEEVVSSLEALHEDIYFETLTLFDLIGNRYGVGALRYPGRVLPYIDPAGTGEPGRARIVFTGKERARNGLTLTHREADGEPVRQRYNLSPLPVDAPKLRGITVDADHDGPARLLFEVVAVDSVDRAAEYAERGSEERIDRTLTSVEMLAGMVERLRDLHRAGILENALSLDRVGEMAFRFVLEDEEAADDGGPGDDGGPEDDEGGGNGSGEPAADGAGADAGGGAHGGADAGTDTGDPDAGRIAGNAPDGDGPFERIVLLPRSEAPRSTDTPELIARDWEWDGERLVQWRTPIGPAENDSILARLATFPTVDVYRMARSFLGQDVWAADLLPPHEAEYVSQAKRNALKPTLFLSGRQHANEVSSTSHILRLAELLATDSAYTELLKRVNVVLHPIMNPDGARLAVEMQETNPDFMLHAGYLGALGVDATAGARSDDPIYPESRVRPEILETWLPDVYVNMHGYPSHEWVQYFAGYSAWVRSRTGTSRTWWAPRGWFIPSFPYVDDDEHPEYRRAQFAALDSIAAAITGDSAVRAMNERMYARYAKYGRQDRETFREYFHDGMLVYLPLRGRESIGSGPGSARITYISLTTEAPDETARGDWLELVASAGLTHGSALLRYLATGTNEIERKTEAYRDFVVRSVFRVKPVVPENTGDEGEAAGVSEP